MRPNRYSVTAGGGLFLLALALTGAAAFLTANNLLFLIFAALVALLLVSGFLSRLVLAGLELELLLPEHLAARMPAPACVRLRNLKRFTPSFSIELSSNVLTGPVYFPAVPGKAMIEAPVEVVFPMRGRHRENFFMITTRFPFGFIRKSARVSLLHDLVVYPALAPHADLEALAESLRGELEASARGSGLDFYRIRPYEPGDDARRVDWKSTAHTGNMQVREFTRDDWRWIEIWLDRRIRHGDEERFERLIDRTAFLSRELSLAGAPVMFRSQDFAFFAESEDESYDILRFLSLTEPIITVTGAVAGVVAGHSRLGEFSSDDSNLQIVFSVSPDSLRCSGDSPGERINIGPG